MLDNVQHINWQAVGVHVYGEPETIPDALQNLLASDPDVRESGRGFLLGSGQDYGDIYDTTSYIIPFILEILGSDTTPDKAELLYHLSAIAENIYLYEHPSVQVMRRYLQAYDALKAGLPTFEQLLKHQDPATRITSAGVLQYMTESAAALVPRLIDRFGEEHDEQVQIALLHSMKTLLPSLRRLSDAHQEYSSFLRAVIDTHASQHVRVAAASTSIELISPHAQKREVVSPHVPELLAQEFLGQIRPFDDILWLYRDRDDIVCDLVMLPSEMAINVLQRPDLTPEQAHMLARALLRSAFLSVDQVRRRWEDVPRFNKHEAGLIYVRDFAAAEYIWYGRAEIVEAIVNTDMVWHTPTNLFSFYFGLPDSREELRELLIKLHNESLRPRQTDQAQDDLPDF